MEVCHCKLALLYAVLDFAFCFVDCASNLSQDGRMASTVESHLQTPPPSLWYHPQSGNCLGSVLPSCDIRESQLVYPPSFKLFQWVSTAAVNGELAQNTTPATAIPPRQSRKQNNQAPLLWLYTITSVRSGHTEGLVQWTFHSGWGYFSGTLKPVLLLCWSYWCTYTIVMQSYSCLLRASSYMFLVGTIYFVEGDYIL